MQRIKFIISMLAILGTVLAIIFVLRGEDALLIHPKGIIADKQLNLIRTNLLLMLVVVAPTFTMLFMMAWKYRAKNSKSTYDPEQSYGVFGESMLWIIPSAVIAVMVVVNWYATHELDPYRPIDSETKPLTIQVVALDWKWLFIYPEQGIAALNFVQFPAGTPIRFELSADGSPMNSFWIPQLSGQIYSMSGMTTLLHIMANGPGEYTGRAVEINGEGYAEMTFVAKSTSPSDFDDWVADIKQSPLQLTHHVYNELVKPSLSNPVTLYSYVEKDLFNKIVMKPYIYTPTTL